MSFASREILGGGIFVPTSDSLDFIEGEQVGVFERRHPPLERRGESKGKDQFDNPKKKIDIIVIFILGTLIFFLLFSWFNIIQILIDIFWEEFYPTEDKETRTRIRYTLVKQITFTSVTTIIFFVFFNFYLSYDNN